MFQRIGVWQTSIFVDWVCYFKDDGMRLYFDSFGQVTPVGIQKYLKAKKEWEMERLLSSVLQI